jgi:hypothetical protein
MLPRQSKRRDVMASTLANQPLDQWQELIDWCGLLCTRGVVLTVRDGTLYAQGPSELLTSEIMAALRRYEPVLVWLLLRADIPAVAWRVAAMLDSLSWSPQSWRNLKARPATTACAGYCRSCGEPLPSATQHPRCADCTQAIRLVLRRVREADLR